MHGVWGLQLDANEVSSCISKDRKGMMRSMLEAVAGGDVTRPADIARYINCTLLAATSSAEVGLLVAPWREQLRLSQVVCGVIPTLVPCPRGGVMCRMGRPPLKGFWELMQLDRGLRLEEHACDRCVTGDVLVR